MYESGPGKVDLHGACMSGPCLLEAWPSLLQDRPFSVSLHLKRSMEDSTFFSISLLGILGPRLALHVHYRLFSVTSEESLRDSEPPEHPGIRTEDFSV